MRGRYQPVFKISRAFGGKKQMDCKPLMNVRDMLAINGVRDDPELDCSLGVAP